MQYTEEEIRDIVRENQILKKNLNDAREELEATGRLYDTMVFGTKNLLLLSDGGSRSAVYVSPNVEERRRGAWTPERAGHERHARTGA